MQDCLCHGLLQLSNVAVVEGLNGLLGEGEVVGAVLPGCVSFDSVKVEDKLQPEAGCRLPAKLVGPRRERFGPEKGGR